MTKDEKLVGIITTTNLMEVLLNAVGLGIDSQRLSLITTDRIGILAEVGQLMHQADINIRSILTIPIPGYKDQWQIMMRISTGLFQQAVDMLRGEGYKVLTVGQAFQPACEGARGLHLTAGWKACPTGTQP